MPPAFNLSQDQTLKLKVQSDITKSKLTYCFDVMQVNANTAVPDRAITPIDCLYC
jgi:hypothetical protein